MAGDSLHIFMTDPHLAGGGQVRYVANLARELGRLGQRVTIGCKPGSVLVARAAEANAAVCDTFFFKGGLRPRVWMHDLRQAAAFIRSAKPDLIHVSGSQDHWVCALATRALGRPACLVRTRHNTYPVRDHLANRVLNRAWTDYQIVVCDVVRRTLAAQRAFDGDRMCSIHNGVDAARFRPDPGARARARAEFGYGEHDFVCGIAARLVPAKGHEFLFRAVAKVRQTHPQVRMLVLGQGDLESRLRQLACDLRIADVVTWTGFRDDMAHCVQAFDAGAQPSIDCDTSSFSLKEQMAAEVPVIASDYGGLTEILTDGVEGYIVPAGTVDPLADALLRMLDSEAERRRMGAAGRARVLREFTVEVFAARTLEAYRRALAIHEVRGVKER
ncbi:MAG TPA: glycosyltransferase family 4 protein [Candidatus Hydrogenedentes bacterium]|nr:glycosyltransferase family 4 protein [Candidatus Hydrogenedentota bacterium]HNT87349.1 glycosyltransferase family 4 protein [Candidatus Hydrogenedentota bacterium]